MPSAQSHRGKHPQDEKLFHDAQQPRLRAAVADLSFLLTRGYADPSAIALVGNRYQLHRRQRQAVRGAACGDDALTIRHQHQVPPTAIKNNTLAIDGFNILITIEAALSGGMLIRGRDHCIRDLASVHGTYRKIEETLPAIERIGNSLANLKIASACWFLDQPVSNSGRLRALLREAAEKMNWNWQVELDYNPDRRLIESEAIVATSDSAVLDRCQRWVNLAEILIEEMLPAPAVIDLTDGHTTGILKSF